MHDYAPPTTKIVSHHHTRTHTVDQLCTHMILLLPVTFTVDLVT
jgi:hypothetical protein